MAYLATAQFLPEDRLGQLLHDVKGLFLSAGTIGQMVCRVARCAQDFSVTVRERVCAAPVKHLDEIGFQVGARPHWLHVAGTSGPEGLVHYRVSPRRGAMLDPAVPFTNNEAESDLRVMKLPQKISGGFRTDDGAENFATLRTLIGTARKRGRNILAALAPEPDHLVAKL